MPSHFFTITHLHSSPRNEDFHGFLFGVGDISKASLWGVVKTAFHCAPKKLMPLGEINGIFPNLLVHRGTERTSWNQPGLGLTGRARDDRIRDHNALRVFSPFFKPESQSKLRAIGPFKKIFKTKHLTGWYVIYTLISIISLEISVHGPCFGLSCGDSMFVSSLKIREPSSNTVKHASRDLKGYSFESTIRSIRSFFGASRSCSYQTWLGVTWGSYTKTSLKPQVHQN